MINQGQVLYNGQPDELLRTTLLAENGIREPLYLTTLRQLGQDIDQLEHLDRLEDIELTGVNRSITEATFTKTGETEEPLKLEQISFAYQKDHPILKDISLTIPERAALSDCREEWGRKINSYESHLWIHYHRWAIHL